jgi:hypothetical protein
MTLSTLPEDFIPCLRPIAGWGRPAGRGRSRRSASNHVAPELGSLRNPTTLPGRDQFIDPFWKPLRRRLRRAPCRSNGIIHARCLCKTVNRHFQQFEPEPEHCGGHCDTNKGHLARHAYLSVLSMNVSGRSFPSRHPPRQRWRIVPRLWQQPPCPPHYPAPLIYINAPIPELCDSAHSSPHFCRA